MEKERRRQARISEKLKAEEAERKEKAVQVHYQSLTQVVKVPSTWTDDQVSHTNTRNLTPSDVVHLQLAKQRHGSQRSRSFEAYNIICRFEVFDHLSRCFKVLETCCIRYIHHNTF